MFLKHDWVISNAICANLATYWDTADQQRPTHEAAIMEVASPKIIKFGFKDSVVDDGSEKRTVVYKVCNSKISDMTTTTSNFIHHCKTHKERYMNVSL